MSAIVVPAFERPYRNLSTSIHVAMAVAKVILHAASVLVCFIVGAALVTAIILVFLHSKVAIGLVLLYLGTGLCLGRLRFVLNRNLKAFTIVLEVLEAHADRTSEVLEELEADFLWLQMCYNTIKDVRQLLQLFLSSVSFTKDMLKGETTLGVDTFLEHFHGDPTLSGMDWGHIDAIGRALYQQISAHLGPPESLKEIEEAVRREVKKAIHEEIERHRPDWEGTATAHRVKETKETVQRRMEEVKQFGEELAETTVAAIRDKGKAVEQQLEDKIRRLEAWAASVQERIQQACAAEGATWQTVAVNQLVKVLGGRRVNQVQKAFLPTSPDELPALEESMRCLLSSLILSQAAAFAYGIPSLLILLGVLLLLLGYLCQVRFFDVHDTLPETVACDMLLATAAIFLLLGCMGLLAACIMLSNLQRSVDDAVTKVKEGVQSTVGAKESDPLTSIRVTTYGAAAQ